MMNSLDEKTRRLIGWYSAMARCARYADRTLRDETGLGLTQARALVFVSMNPGTPMSATAESLRLERSTATACADFLEGEGLIVRWRDGADGRIIRAAATDKGNGALSEVFGSLSGVFSELRSWVLPGRSGDLDGFLQGCFGVCGDGFEGLARPIRACMEGSLGLEGLDADALSKSMGSLERACCVYQGMLRVGRSYRLGRNETLILALLLASDGKVSQIAIREGLHMVSGESTICLDKLCRVKYAKRIVVKDDRRRHDVVLTKSGRLLIASLLSEMLPYIDSQCPGLLEADAQSYFA